MSYNFRYNDEECEENSEDSVCEQVGTEAIDKQEGGKLSLIALIAKAISEKDFILMCDIKNICDRLHDGEQEVEYKGNTYTPDDLPSDSVYEQLESEIQLMSSSKAIEATITTHKQSIRDYFMGSVPKESSIRSIDDVVIMPKYDGCSVGLTFVRSTVDNKFDLQFARTRGQVISKSGTATRKWQNVTDKVKPLVYNIIEGLNDKRNQDYVLNVVTLKDVNQVILRAEIVLKNIDAADGSPPASVVSGKLNGGYEVWSNFINNVVIKPFEVVCIIARNVFTISQFEAINFMHEINCDMCYVSAKALRTNEKSLNYIRMLFNTSFKDKALEPIDGVVYCAKSWKYPFDKTDHGKSDYGKYAWKPSNETTTVITGIEPICSKEGYIEFTAIYEPRFMNSSEYKQCRIVPTAIAKYGENFGIGSLITIKLHDDIMPCINSCEAPVDNPKFKPFEFPKQCPFCNNELEHIVKGKGDKQTVRLQCHNETCGPRNLKLCAAVIKSLGIKGLGEKTINKFFIDHVKDESERNIYTLLTHKKSKAFTTFVSTGAELTVRQFFLTAFTNIKGSKQQEALFEKYGVSNVLLNEVKTIRNVLSKLANDETLSSFTRDVARAFLKLK